jgi:Zn-dependent membrane protease YugP
VTSRSKAAESIRLLLLLLLFAVYATAAAAANVVSFATALLFLLVLLPHESAAPSGRERTRRRNATQTAMGEPIRR